MPNGRADSTARELLRHGGVVFAATLVVNLSTFAFHFAYSRDLGPRGYGALYSVINVASFITVIAGILTVLVTKIVADAALTRVHLGGVARKALQGSAVFGLALALLVFALTVPIAEFLHLQPLAVVLLGSFTAAQLLLAGARGVAQGTQMFVPLAWSLTIEGVLRTILAIALLGTVSGILLAVASYTFASFVALAYTIFALRASYGLGGSAPVFDVRRLLKTSSGIAISALAIAVLSTADVVLVRHYFSNEQSGMYSAVALAGKTLFFAVSFLPMILLPKAGEAASKGTSKQLLLSAGGMVGALSAIALAVFFVVPKIILHVVSGSAYEAAATFVFPYAVAMAALGAANGLAAYRMGLNDFSYVWSAVILSVVECLAIVIYHENISSVIGIVLVVSIAFLGYLIGGLKKAVSAPVPVAQSVILFQEELEAH